MSEEYTNGYSYKLNVPQKVGNICGLHAWKISNNELISLRKDCQKLLENYKPEKTKNGRRRMSNFIELGNSFISTEDKKQSHFKFIEPSSIHELNVLKFIFYQMDTHSNYILNECVSNNFKVPSFADFNLINVMIREYNPGQSIGFHIDRIEKLDDMIWSCIVNCGSPTDGLHYKFKDISGNNIDIPFLEKPGCVSVQTGPARYLYNHGIHKTNSHRISITWRFFRQEYLRNVNGYYNTINSYLNTLQKIFEYNQNQKKKIITFNLKLEQKESQLLSEPVDQSVIKQEILQNKSYTLFSNQSLFSQSIKSNKIPIAQEIKPQANYNEIPLAESVSFNIDIPNNNYQFDPKTLDWVDSLTNDSSNNIFQENKMIEVLKKCNLKNYKDTYTKLMNEDVELEQLHLFNLEDFRDVNIGDFDALKIIAFFNPFT